MEKIIIQETDFNKTRKTLRENPGKRTIFHSDDDELNRKILEKEQISVLLISQRTRKDFQKQRNSGFNQVMAKLAKKKNVTIGIELDEIITSYAKEKSGILARIRQNIKLCGKNKLKMNFVCLKKDYERNNYDLKALGTVLGMPTWMTKAI
jgi:RNase P/RNase MRP subunit p30